MRKTLIIILSLTTFSMASGQIQSLNSFLYQKSIQPSIEKCYSNGRLLFSEDSELTRNKIGKLLNDEADVTFEKYKTISGTLNTEIVYEKYKQYYKGIPVEGGGYKLGLRKDKDKKESIHRLSPKVFSGINLDISPAVNNSQLLEVLKCDKIYEAQLIISTKNSSTYKLVWQVDYLNNNPRRALVDATNGKIIDDKSTLTPKDAITQSFGTVNMNDTDQNGETRLISAGDRVTTYDFNEQDLWAGDQNDFTQDKIPFIPDTQAEWNLTNSTDDVFQAHWVVQNTVEEFENSLGIVFNNVHVGSNFANNGGSGNAYGYFDFNSLDESWFRFGRLGLPKTSYAEYDIAGHELAHAYLGDVSDLDITMLEPGSLHEGISDMFGAYIELQLDPNDSDPNGFDWVIGDDVPIPVTSPDYRDLSEYNVFSSGINQTHNRGRALGHWFYVLSSGDLGIPQIGMTTVLDIIMNAVINLDADSDYDDLMIETLIVAEDNYGGICSPTYQALVQAWEHIQVPQNFSIVLESCCKISPDVEIISNTILNSIYEFGGNVIVKQGVSLTLDNSQITFAENKGIIVEDGGNLIIKNGSTLSTCNNSERKWQGVELKDGSRLTMTNGFIDDAQVGLLVGNVESQNFFIENNRFRNCHFGIRAVGCDNFQIEGTPMAGGIFDGLNLFENCEYGIYTNLGEGTVKNNFFIHCSTAITIENSVGPVEIMDNIIGYVEYGVKALWADDLVTIAHNEIGIMEAGRTGISCTLSAVAIYDNTIVATRNGIHSSFNFSADPGLIHHNNVTIDGPLMTMNRGIYSFWTQGLTVEHNNIFGEELKAAINSQYGFSNTIQSNTISAEDCDNGIAITGGANNSIQLNLIETPPVNGILNTVSIGNKYHDNDISAIIQGLSIGVDSETQEITCNRFCSALIDLKIKSNLKNQQNQLNHLRNQFRQANSQAQVENLSLDEIAESSFTYDPNDQEEDVGCAVMELFPFDAPVGLFDPNTSVGNRECSEEVGSNLVGMTEEILCQEILELLGPKYFLNLRQLLGRYYDALGPKQLPDCVPECGLTELARMESELRSTMRGGDISTSLESPLASIRSIASKQYAQLEGELDSDLAVVEPCDSFDILYLETYKKITKELSGRQLDAVDFQELQPIANLCYEEYGEVVGWARGLLDIYSEEYIDKDCSEPLEDRTIKLKAGISLELSPIPVSDILQVRIIGNSHGLGKIRLIDITGRILLQKEMTDEHTIQINVSHLENGYYVVRYEDETKVVITESFTIFH